MMRRSIGLGTWAILMVFALTHMPPASAQVLARDDTMLHVSHSWIVASIVGCDIHTDDRVLVNGHAADGIAWDSLKIEAASQTPVTSREEASLLGVLHKDPATIPPQVTLRLKPGYYRNFALQVGNCMLGPVPLVAADFYGLRHLTLVARPVPSKISIDAAESSGFFGEIPLLDVQVRLVSADMARSYVARNEDDSDFLGHHFMYFFDAVKPGAYDLSVIGFGWQQDLGAVNIARQDDPIFRAITPTQLGLNI